MNWFNLTFRLKNYPLKRAKKHLAEIGFISESNYERHIETKKQEILEYHIANTPYYKELCGGKKPESWSDVPVLTKSNLQHAFEKRLSQDFKPNQVYVNKTSGSSGHPFTFAKDKYCHALTWANIVSKFGWYDIDFNTSYQARFYGIPLDFFGNLKERTKDVLARRHRFPIFNLNDKTLEKYLNEFKKRPFDHINGYTSALVLLAKYLKEERTVLKDICPTLKVCITTSEMLFEDDRALLESSFGIPVVNEYGASELDIIAFENPKSEWQLNTETLFIEVLDNQNNKIPNGTKGKLVITSLYNKAHPFIRYEIGDVGVIKNGSTVKNAFLEKLIGRTNDVAILPSGKTVPGLTFYYVTKSIIKDDSEVKEFVITQTHINAFKIEYVADKELPNTLKLKISKAMNTYLEPNLKLELIKVDQLQRNKSGKLKQFTTHL